MFDRPHHQRIARVLESLNGAVLRDHQCLFGGGTSIALRYGEYRESVDIDLLVSARDRYRELRHAVTGADGLPAILRPAVVLEQTSELRADQYGIRTWLSIDGQSIKLEIVLEGRINLDAPGPTDVVCGIATLTSLDMAASKLLANSDRWMDDGVFSRDLIDLAREAATAARRGSESRRSLWACGPARSASRHRQDPGEDRVARTVHDRDANGCPTRAGVAADQSTSACAAMGRTRATASLSLDGATALPHYSPRYAARTFGSLSICLASPCMVIRPDSIT